MSFAEYSLVVGKLSTKRPISHAGKSANGTGLEFYQQNEKYLKVLLCTPGKSDLSEFMKNAIKQTMRASLEYQDIARAAHDEYALEYFSSGVVGVISLWVAEGMKTPLPELSEEVAKISQDGVVSYLLKGTTPRERTGDSAA